jgi:hypothetical protein
MALGAQREDIVKLALYSAVRVALAGSALGALT